MFVLFLPCLSRYDVHDHDDHDDNGVTLSWYPGVMRRIQTAAKWRESTASLNNTDNTESVSGKNPHGAEAERIHNSAPHQLIPCFSSSGLLSRNAIANWYTRSHGNMMLQLLAARGKCRSIKECRCIKPCARAVCGARIQNSRACRGGCRGSGSCGRSRFRKPPKVFP